MIYKNEGGRMKIYVIKKDERGEGYLVPIELNEELSIIIKGLINHCETSNGDISARP